MRASRRRLLGLITAWIAPRRTAAKLSAQLEDFRDGRLFAERRQSELERDLADERERLAEARQELAMANARIETMQVSLDGMASCVEQYRSQFDAIARINSMKGQPPDANDLAIGALTR